MNRSTLYKRSISTIVLLPLFIFIIYEGSYVFNILLVFALSISILEWIKFKINSVNKILGIFFLFVSFYCAYLFRSSDMVYALAYFFLVTIISISTDLGGFVFGKIFKGPKVSKISPNKTYSGIIGSFLLSIFFSYFFIVNYTNGKIIFYFHEIILLSTISQSGDFIVSFFKRKSKIKDTGNIIPGHGGILDRIDGMIFSYPFGYLFFIS